MLVSLTSTDSGPEEWKSILTQPKNLRDTRSWCVGTPPF